ncbi:hypothetical protein PR048_026983 [Dryococelus australis]|uniref:Uncharacterized protein n=1 Tax=Dryococelus australis TaxID=614101 RepID=A0ABQ9GMV2_9NEOP|nr:hypothetical protein PR048_026983 [Dryococelus australis]
MLVNNTLLTARGATVAQGLGCSPPTKANRVRVPSWSLPVCARGKSRRTVPLIGGFSRGSPVSPAHLIRHCSGVEILDESRRFLAIPRERCKWPVHGEKNAGIVAVYSSPSPQVITSMNSASEQVTAMNIVLRADEGEVRWKCSSAGMQEHGKKKITKKTHPPPAMSNTIGFEVAERLACSRSTKASRVQSPSVSLPDFRMWESCRTIPLVGRFSRGSAVSNTPSFRRCSILVSITLTGSQDISVKSSPNLVSHTLFNPVQSPQYACAVWCSCSRTEQVDVALNHICRLTPGCLKSTPVE